MIQTIRRAPRALLVCLALSLTACDEALGPNDGEGDDASRVSVQYGGARTGRFQAQGEIPTSNVTSSTWAAAERDDDFSDTRVYGLHLRPDGRHDIVAIILTNDEATGSYDASSTCRATCAQIRLNFGGSTQAGQAAEWECTVNSGSVNLTALSDERVRGTFSGVARCVNPAQPDQPQQTLTLQDGAFDVAVTYAI